MCCFWNPQIGGRREYLGAFFACIAYLFISQAAFAQTHVAARVDWYGIYTISNRPEPNDPSGKRYVGTPVAVEFDGQDSRKGRRTLWIFLYPFRRKRSQRYSQARLPISSRWNAG